MATECIVPTCSDRAHARRLCRPHLYRMETWGDPLHPLLRDQTRTLVSTWGTRSQTFVVPELAARHIDVAPSGCWEWTGHIDEQGYARLGGVGGAHRGLYESLIGPVPEGLELDHLCKVNHCVSPLHLEPVTGLENMRRRYADMTHCKSGHEFTEANTYTRPTGHRQCRRCNSDAALRYQQRKRRRGAA